MDTACMGPTSCRLITITEKLSRDQHAVQQPGPARRRERESVVAPGPRCHGSNVGIQAATQLRGTKQR